MTDQRLETMNLWFDQFAKSQIIVYYIHKEARVTLHLLVTPRLFPVVTILRLSDHNEEQVGQAHIAVLSTWLETYAHKTYGLDLPAIADLTMDQKLMQALVNGLAL